MSEGNKYFSINNQPPLIPGYCVISKIVNDSVKKKGYGEYLFYYL